MPYEVTEEQARTSDDWCVKYDERMGFIWGQPPRMPAQSGVAGSGDQMNQGRKRLTLLPPRMHFGAFGKKVIRPGFLLHSHF